MPCIDQAIAIEVQNTIDSGESVDFDELWQKWGEIAAGTILGISVSALFGIVYAYTRTSIPGSNNKKTFLYSWSG